MPDTNTSATVTESKIQNQCTNVSYPQVQGLKDETVQNQINDLIKSQFLGLIPAEGCDVYQDITGKYVVELNKNGILSIKFDIYTIRQHAANGLNVQRSITFDLATGKVYQLYELFKRNSDYRIVLSRMIKKQIEERDLPVIKEFTGITDYEGYYLTENALVIYFQEITYFPHYAGIQEFAIPYSQIRNLINPEGPIARLINQD